MPLPEPDNDCGLVMAEGRGYGRGDSRGEGGGDWEEIRQGSCEPFVKE